MSKLRGGATSHNVLVVGSCIYDFLCFVERMPRKGETLVAERSERRVGGKGFNQAVALSRLDCDVTFVGAIGKDALGEAFHEFSSEEHLEFRPEIISMKATGMAAPIITPDGVSSIVVDTGAALSLSIAHLRSVLDMNSWDGIVCHYEIPVYALEFLFNWGNEKSVPIFCNPAPWIGADGIGFVRRASAVVLNEFEGKRLLADIGLVGDHLRASEIAKECSAACEGELLILTLGAQGAIAVAGGRRTNYDSVPISVVDTTGAGDSFCAAVTFGILTGWSIDHAIAFASAAAALTCGHQGGADAMPSYSDVARLVEARGLWS